MVFPKEFPTKQCHLILTRQIWMFNECTRCSLKQIIELLNFYRYLNRKVKVEEPAPKRPNKWGMTFYLVPEFCITHPCPASLWKQTAWMPSILYRLNTLLLAEEFRLKIVREAQVGSEKNPKGIYSSLIHQYLLRTFPNV